MPTRMPLGRPKTLTCSYVPSAGAGSPEVCSDRSGIQRLRRTIDDEGIAASHEVEQHQQPGTPVPAATTGQLGAEPGAHFPVYSGWFRDTERGHPLCPDI
jgi:hypothetical protein